MKRLYQEEDDKQQQQQPESITVSLLPELIDQILLLTYALDEEDYDGLFNLFYLTKILYHTEYRKIYKKRLLTCVETVCHFILPSLRQERLGLLRNLRYLEFEASYFSTVYGNKRAEFTRFMTDLQWVGLWFNLKELSLKYCDISFTEEATEALSKLEKLYLGPRSTTNFTHFSRLVNLVSLEAGDCSESNLCDDDLIGLTRNSSKLRHFCCYSLEYVTDASMRHLTMLESLDLSRNENITNAGLYSLYSGGGSLRSLVLSQNSKIDDIAEGGRELFMAMSESLTSLDLSYNFSVGNESVARMTNLKSLVLSHNSRITNSGIWYLTKLENLDLSHNDCISMNALKDMNQLRSLDLSACTGLAIRPMVTYPAWMTNLKELGLNHNNVVSNEALMRMTNLESLRIERNTHIREDSLVNLTSLTSLSIMFSPHITMSCMGRLTLLKKIILSRNDVIDHHVLTKLVNLHSICGVVSINSFQYCLRQTYPAPYLVPVRKKINF